MRTVEPHLRHVSPEICLLNYAHLVISSTATDSPRMSQTSYIAYMDMSNVHVHGYEQPQP